MPLPLIAPAPRSPPTVPRLESRRCDHARTEGEKRPIPPQSQSGKSVWVSGTSPIEGVAASPQGERSVPLGEYPEGVSPLGDSLVTFSSGRKSPGCRAERLHRWVQGPPSPHKSSPGPRGGAPAPRVELGAGSARQLTGRLLCFTIGIKFYWNMVESR